MTRNERHKRWQRLKKKLDKFKRTTNIPVGFYRSGNYVCADFFIPGLSEMQNMKWPISTQSKTIQAHVLLLIG